MVSLLINRTDIGRATTANSKTGHACALEIASGKTLTLVFQDESDHTKVMAWAAAGELA